MKKAKAKNGKKLSKAHLKEDMGKQREIIEESGEISKLAKSLLKDDKVAMKKMTKKKGVGKQVKGEMAAGGLVKGKAAAKPKNMQHNKRVMEKAGYSKKRAEGTAYGEVGMEKMARRHESEGMKKAMAKKKASAKSSPKAKRK